MKKTISIIRIAILIALAYLAICLIFGEELDESLSAWLLHCLIDKSIGAAIAFAIWLLGKRWSKTDPWIGDVDNEDSEDEYDPFRL